MRYRSVRVKPTIHIHTRCSLQKIPGGNKDELAALRKMIDSLLDKEKKKISAQIE